MPPNRVVVRVPATTANLGPAFDCMGLVLNLYSTIVLERATEASVEVRGYGAQRLARGSDNLVYRAAATVYQRLGREPPPLRMVCHNSIPLRRGMGSSSAAAVGGIVAANALEDNPLSPADLLRLATDIEGHPDNVAPALLGGCQIVVDDGGKLVTASVPLRRGLRAVVFIPEMEVPTKKARGLLSKQVNRSDAVYNAGRTALLALALSQGRWELLGVATQDRLHQQPRQALMPAMEPVFEAATKAGACGVFLSGAGPTILALTAGDTAPIGKAMAEAAAANSFPGAWRSMGIGGRGAHVVETA
ncbi:MAG: homoserine kinase [Chloroflexi bacterium]|nr:homoserine kinase [Chloroflexota bacterium]